MKSAFRKFFFACLGLCIAACLILSGCQWKPLSDPPDSDTLPVDAKPDTSQSDTEATQPPVVYYHAFTGLACEESLSLARPVAFFLDNTSNGVSQLGTSLADVLIEAPVDNGTRFAALITDLERAAAIGPIRSARSWLADVVRGFDAVAVYHGTSDTVGEIPTVFPGMDCIDYAQNANGDIFYKDPSIVAPFQLKTSGERIRNALLNSSWKQEASPDLKPYSLADPNSAFSLGGTAAHRIRCALAPSTQFEYTYNSLTKTYLRYQNGTPHIDGGNGKQLEFTNLVFLFCNVNSYSSAGGSVYSLDMTSGGEGYYVSHGESIGISWNMDENGMIHFKSNDGTSLTLHCGKTYIGLVKISDRASLNIQ